MNRPKFDLAKTGVKIKAAMLELDSRDFRLLVGLTAVAIIEGITYAWIEVLLYTSDNPVLFHTWIAGHYTSYHLVLALLVFTMIFGTGYFAWSTYPPMRFRKVFLLSLGEFVLWIFLEDEFTFIFSHAPHTATDWTNWPFGALDISGHYVPMWYVAAAIGIFILWYLGLSTQDEKDLMTEVSRMDKAPTNDSNNQEILNASGTQVRSKSS